MYYIIYSRNILYHIVIDERKCDSPCPVTSRREIIEANKNKHNIAIDVFSLILRSVFI